MGEFAEVHKELSCLDEDNAAVSTRVNVHRVTARLTPCRMSGTRRPWKPGKRLGTAGMGRQYLLDSAIIDLDVFLVSQS